MRSSAAGRLAALVVAAALGACGPAQPSFRSIDVTGADFGRELRLTDHTGRVRTLADFKGKVTVVSFGFTRCPDVCPTTLAELKLVKEKLGKDGERLQVLFVSVDPERDNPDLIGEYAHAFHRDTLAATADVPALEAFARSLSMVFAKVPAPDGAPADQYSMDHSASLAVLDPQGRLTGFIQPPFDPKAIAADMAALSEAAK